MMIEPVILVGGKSSRLGENKAFLSIDGIRILQRVCRILKDVFQREPVLVGKAPSDMSCESVIDLIEGLGPIGGLLTALEHTDADAIFLTGCDMPFINQTLIRFMLESFKTDSDIYIPIYGSGLIEPLFAIYRKKIYPVVKKQIASGDYRMRTLLGNCRVQFLSEDRISAIDPQFLSFFNINTKKELEFARRILKSEKN